MRNLMPSPTLDAAVDPAFATSPGPNLAAKLDAVLATHPAVRAVSPDPVAEALSNGLGGAARELAIRRVRLVGAGPVSVAAVPSAAWHDPGAKVSALSLRRAAAHLGRRVVLVTEAWLDREPRLANALLVASCASAPVAPRDRLSLMSALLDAGGELPLADAAEVMTSADDPVAAVLALGAHRVLALGMDEPVGPATRVSPRRTEFSR